MAKLDELDRSIIELLNLDARMPSALIARQLGKAERTVHNRILRLINTDVIHPVAIVNPAAFGYTLAVDIFCELEVGYQDQAADVLQDMPEVTYVAISTGDQDISIQAIFKDGDEINDFITHKLPRVPGIRRTRTVLIPRIVKDTYRWLPPPDSFSS